MDMQRFSYQSHGNSSFIPEWAAETGTNENQTRTSAETSLGDSLEDIFSRMDLKTPDIDNLLNEYDLHNGVLPDLNGQLEDIKIENEVTVQDSCDQQEVIYTNAAREPNIQAEIDSQLTSPESENLIAFTAVIRGNTIYKLEINGNPDLIPVGTVCNHQSTKHAPVTSSSNQNQIIGRPSVLSAPMCVPVIPQHDYNQAQPAPAIFQICTDTSSISEEFQHPVQRFKTKQSLKGINTNTTDFMTTAFKIHQRNGEKAFELVHVGIDEEKTDKKIDHKNDIKLSHPNDDQHPTALNEPGISHSSSQPSIGIKVDCALTKYTLYYRLEPVISQARSKLAIRKLHWKKIITEFGKPAFRTLFIADEVINGCASGRKHNKKAMKKFNEEKVCAIAEFLAWLLSNPVREKITTEGLLNFVVKVHKKGKPALNSKKYKFFEERILHKFASEKRRKLQRENQEVSKEQVVKVK